MQDVNVVVTFCSRTGSTEALALAAAVGAVQARANIRLRWLCETADPQAVDSMPEWKENRTRMQKEYVSPRPADAEWADVLMVGVPARLTISSPELKQYLDSLATMVTEGKLQPKLATAFLSGDGEDTSVLPALGGTLVQLGFIVVPNDAAGRAAQPRDRVRLQARRATEVARALKRASL